MRISVNRLSQIIAAAIVYMYGREQKKVARPVPRQVARQVAQVARQVAHPVPRPVPRQVAHPVPRPVPRQVARPVALIQLLPVVILTLCILEKQ